MGFEIRSKIDEGYGLKFSCYLSSLRKPPSLDSEWELIGVELNRVGKPSKNFYYALRGGLLQSDIDKLRQFGDKHGQDVLIEVFGIKGPPFPIDI